MKEPELDLWSLQEADTRIILHYLHINGTSPASTKIVVRSPDKVTLIVSLLKFAQDIEQTVLFDTDSGDEKRLLSVKEINERKQRFKYMIHTAVCTLVYRL